MNLKDIVDDYELNFCNKKCEITTNYKELPTFLVYFEINDLYHLLGIHKLKTKYRATNWIKAVKSDSFILSKYSKHPNFREVIPRINNYNFLYEIFYQFQVNVCVLEKDLSRNTMELSIVFYKDDSKKIVVIGLKKDRTGVFRVATLHESRTNKYKSIRYTMIKSINWL
ncbi:PBECR4 domain-containing protein [Streptococcus suis]|nr:PBECR4 domain-containing protein [Streptococcus suis]